MVGRRWRRPRRLRVLTEMPRGRVLFVEQSREQLGRGDALARATTTHKPKELRRVRVDAPLLNCVKYPLAGTGEVLPALVGDYCREIQRFRHAGAVDAMQLFV